MKNTKTVRMESKDRLVDFLNRLEDRGFAIYRIWFMFKGFEKDFVFR